MGDTLNLFRDGAVGFIDWLGLVRLINLRVQRCTTEWAESKILWHGKATARLSDSHADVAGAMCATKTEHAV